MYSCETAKKNDRLKIRFTSRIWFWTDWFWTGNLWYLWYGLWWSGALDFERMPGSYEAADFRFVWRFGVMNQNSYSILL